VDLRHRRVEGFCGERTGSQPGQGYGHPGG
jgi:hypothetical protein